jgi:hypothetical protein
LTDARRNSVAESLGTEFMLQPAPIPNAALFVNPPNRRTVFVADHQVNLTQDGEDLRFDPDNWLHTLGGLRDALLLDNRFAGMVQLVAHVDAEGSATEQSVHFFAPLPDAEMRTRFEGLRGIGLRINYERPPYAVDVLVEPFFQNTERFFLKLNATGQAPVQLERLVTDADEFCGFLSENTLEFLEEVLKD